MLLLRANTLDNDKTLFTIVRYVQIYEPFTGCWVCEILLCLKGSNVIIEQVGQSLDNEYLTCQFVLFIVFWVIM